MRYNFVSLAEKSPVRAKLWHPLKNGDLLPEQVAYGSEKVVWWLCSSGHEWSGPINRKSGCPSCNESFQTSFPELTLRYFIRYVFPDTIATFSGESFGKYKSADLYIPSLKLIIEHDGYFYHKDHVERDRDKSQILMNAGFNVLRVRQHSKGKLPDLSLSGLHILEYTYSSNENKLQNSMLDVLRHIRRNFLLNEKETESIEVLTKTPFKYLRMFILDQVMPVIKSNHILMVSPQLEREWNHKRNLSYKPIHFTSNSGVKVWWLCENGHEWDAVIATRTRLGAGCPYCAGLLPTEENSLAQIHPELAARWDYSRNDNLTPYDILPSSNKSIYWLCDKCGESYPMKPCLYSSGKQRGCSYCTGKKVNKSNCLATRHPEIAVEWHPDNSKTPYEVSTGSKYKALWQCKVCNHEWRTPVHTRTGPRKSGCGECNRGGWSDSISYAESLSALVPDVAKQWDYENNHNRPEHVRPGSHQKVWWKCENGHGWLAPIYSRKKAFCKRCPRPDRKKQTDSSS